MTEAPTVEQLRRDVFAILRRHDVSEQCFAEVAMVTHAFRTQQPRPDASVDGLRVDFEKTFMLVFETYNRAADSFHDYETWALWQHHKIIKAFSLMQKVRAALTTREAIVEECAKVAEAHFAGKNEAGRRCGHDIATAIRALAAKEVE